MTLFDNRVFLHKDGNALMLVVNMTGEIIFEAQGVRYEVNKAWHEYADNNKLVVLDSFNGKVKYTGKGVR